MTIPRYIGLLLAALLLPASAVGTPEPQPCERCLLLDDFEAYRANELPSRWQFLTDGRLVPVSPRFMSEQERFVVLEEDGNHFVRVSVKNQSHRIMLANGERFDWSLDAHPKLRWRWRALQLPAGAREDERGKNDTGLAVYVFFDRDWLGRPKSIKYTYSSTLPVGTTVDYGNLKVVVASSGQNGTGQWQTIERDVRADYRRLFGSRPPARPNSIALWSDSDNTGATVVGDFDDLTLLTP